MNVAVPMLPIIPCDVSPVLLDLPVVMCRTRYTCPGNEKARQDECFAHLSRFQWQIRATPAMIAITSIVPYQSFRA